MMLGDHHQIGTLLGGDLVEELATEPARLILCLKGTDPQPGSGGGPSSDKMLWLFLAFLGLIDRAVIGNNLGGIFAVALAALAIGLIIWTFSWWQDLLSF